MPLVVLLLMWAPIFVVPEFYGLGAAPEGQTRWEKIRRRGLLYFCSVFTILAAVGLVYGIATRRPCLRSHAETKPNGQACFSVIVATWCVPVEDTQTVCDERAP